MVLDPLSAFSVACNVIQVIETGCKILATASDYRKAADGAPREQKELRGIARTLENLSKGLQSSLSSSTKSGHISSEEVRLIDANNECLEVSREFIEILDRLKVKSQYATMESLRMSIKARWYKDRIETTKQALSEARNNLNIAFLLYMHSEQVSASQQIEDVITYSTGQVEQNVLTAVNSSSAAMQDEIRDLAEQLTETYLDSEEKTVAGFMSIHQTTLDDILAQIKAVAATQGLSQSSRSEDRVSAANQNILASLCFQQINDREDQIQNAYSSTYQWMLQPTNEKWQHWDCFNTWLQSCNHQSQLYWVHGKPGSGKSTLMKFLDKNILVEDHMSRWAQGMPVLKATCFFWASVSVLQKSLGGLYRSLLLQLFEQRPDTMSRVVSARKWRAAEVVTTEQSLTWTDSELRTIFEDLVAILKLTTKVFLLIDGLDEFEGSDEEQDYLIQLLHDIVVHENIKVCVSSRPLSIFNEALQQCPQLRLEDLTRSDIRLVVTSQLEHNSRFSSIQHSKTDESNALITAIISKANGVFLWIRLVLRELLRALRDGDSLKQLRRRLDDVPSDLDKYFRQIIDCIEPQYRREASAMLQIALYEEPAFTSIRPLFLSDFCFVEGLHEDVDVFDKYKSDDIPMFHRQEMASCLDSAYRKVNSRCVGLLECVQSGYQDGLAEADTELDNVHTTVAPLTARNQKDDITLSPSEGPDYEVLHLSYTRIELFHRTLHDFLMTPSMQEHLHQDTDGPLNVRVVLYNAWAKHFITRVYAGANDEFTKDLASHLLSALSADRHTRMAAKIASHVENAMVLFANDRKPSTRSWYIGTSLERWHVEQSNFLTLAIDFRLSSYAIPRLTPAAIRNKLGRPMLDYILRPRFSHDSRIGIGNRFPDAELLTKVLECGADPNEKTKTGPNSYISVWALFLCSYCDMLLHDAIDDEEDIACFAALSTLINAGASPFLTYAELSVPQQDDYYFRLLSEDSSISRDGLFRRRWPILEATSQCPSALGVDVMYALSDVLECFRSHFGSGMDDLVQLSKRKEAEHLRKIHGSSGT